MKCNLHDNEELEYNQHERLELQHQFASMAKRVVEGEIAKLCTRCVQTPHL